MLLSAQEKFKMEPMNLADLIAAQNSAFTRSWTLRGSP